MSEIGAISNEDTTVWRGLWQSQEPVLIRLCKDRAEASKDRPTCFGKEVRATDLFEISHVKDG